jgi:integrase
VSRRHEKPIRRVNPSGAVRFVARWTDRHGKTRSAGTYALKGPCRTPGEGCCAQHAIDAAYDRETEAPRRYDTVGAYAETWMRRHPRSERTSKTYDQRVRRTLAIELEGRPFRDWPMTEIKRRHMADLVDVLLRKHGRAAAGALGVVQVLSAMWEDAIGDEVADANPCKGVKVRKSDPRVRKAPREIRVFSWEQMYAFAAAAGQVRTGMPETDRWRATYAEPFVRCMADAGLRLGEALALRQDGVAAGWLRVQQTAHDGSLLAGTKTDHGKANAGRRVPLKPELERMLRALPPRLDGADLMFRSPLGAIWRENMVYERIWQPAQRATGLDIRPHEMRHSWVSLLLAAGADPADLAKWAGHTVATMYRRYAHSTGDSADAVRRMIGG